jgi:hypothetical protein
MGFQYRMLERTRGEGCDRDGAVHYCFVCGLPFRIADAAYCERCDWWRAPCGHCACDLGPAERADLELAFAEVCGTCRLNPKKRKSRGGSVIRGVSRQEFLEWAERNFPDLTGRYRAGAIGFDELLAEVQRRTGLVWVFG